jgi:WD40 repeat protein
VLGLLIVLIVGVLAWLVVRHILQTLTIPVLPAAYQSVFKTDHTRLTAVHGGHGDAVTALAFGPEEGTLYTASADQTLKSWGAADGKQLQTFSGHAGAVTCLTLSTDRKYLLSGSADQTVKLWDPATGKELKRFEGHTSPVRAVAFAQHGEFISAGADGSVRHWTVAGGPLKVRQGAYAVTSMAASADGRLVICGDEGGRLEIVNSGDQGEARVLKSHPREVTCVALSADGRYALSGSQDQTVKLWDVAAGKELRTLHGHTNWVTGVCFSPDGKRAASVSDDLTVWLWGLGDGLPNDRIELGQCGDGPRCVAFTPDGRALLVGTANAVVLRFELKN